MKSKANQSEFKKLRHDWGGWIGFIASAKNPELITQHFANNIPPIWPKLDLKQIPATIQLGYLYYIARPYLGARIYNKGLLNNKCFLN